MNVKFLGKVLSFQQFIRMRLKVLLIFLGLVPTFCDKTLASVEFGCGLVHKIPFNLTFLPFFFLSCNTEIKYMTELVKHEIVSQHCGRWFKWQQDQKCEDFFKCSETQER